MKTYLFIALTISFSSAQAFQTQALEAYDKATSYEMLFCDGSSAEACEHYKRNLGVDIKKRPLKYRKENAETLIVQASDGRQVRVENKAASPDYKINGREVSLLEYNQRQDVREAVAKNIPQSTPYYSSDKVAVGKVNTEIVAAIEALMSKTQNFNDCESLRKFSDLCLDKKLKLDESLIQSEKAWKEGSIKDKQNQIKAAKVYVAKMEQLSAKIQKKFSEAMPTTLQQCSAQGTPYLEVDFNSCVEVVNVWSKALRKMNISMELQITNTLLERESTKLKQKPALAAPSSPKSGEGVQ